MRHRKLVVGAILVDSLQEPTVILAAQRSDPAALAGQWEFAGGKVEEGEHPVAALRREIREEFGVEIEIGAEIVNPQGHGWPISDSMTMRTWLALATSGVPKVGGSHLDIRWLAEADLWAVPWVLVDALVVDQLVTESILKRSEHASHG